MKFLRFVFTCAVVLFVVTVGFSSEVLWKKEQFMTCRDIPWLYENGVRYMNTETVSHRPNLMPEFYLLARLLWKVDIDQDKELAEFYSNFFGPAAENMEAYINEDPVTSHTRIYRS